ncbi:MAG: SIS domain-containing protein [Pelagibacteraceae bacterium]
MKNTIIIKDNILKKYHNKKNIKKNIRKAKLEIEHIKKKIKIEKNPFYFFNNIDLDLKNINKFNKYSTIVVIGMGGSILGAQAIYTFLKRKINKKFFFVNNIDVALLDKLKKNKDFKKLLFIIISKSGNTLETLTNISYLKKLNINSNNSIIITEKKASALSDYASKKKIFLIKHKKFIGGRYSVLSEVGMLPAKLMNLKIENFKKNLNQLFKDKIKLSLSKTTSIMAENYKNKKIKSLIFLNYCPELNDFVYWCQQLIAESLGKKGMGILPILSQAPKDHHSLLQLYLDGPQDKVFYILSSKNKYNNKSLKNSFNKNFNFLNNKNIENIVNAQKNSLISIFKKKNIPYKEIVVKEISETSIGHLFSYFMLETVIIGKLIGVNPYDQPAVEELKTITKKLLN